MKEVDTESDDRILDRTIEELTCLCVHTTV